MPIPVVKIVEPLLSLIMIKLARIQSVFWLLQALLRLGES